MKRTDDSALRIGVWRVDPSLDEISKDGNTVKLEHRAMRLLLCLADNGGEIVSVERLLDEVWAGVVVTQDSVYHAVAALRRQLGDDTKQPAYIANVPRLGYRLVAKVAPWSDAPNVPVENSPAVEPVRAGLSIANSGVAWRAFAMASGVLAVALAYVSIDKFWHSKSIPASPPASVAAMPLEDKSIAVLPLNDLSEKKDQEYFADGIADEILNLLTKIPELKVAGRTSSFRYKGKADDVRAIGAALGVAYVVEGSVRRSGDRVRITVQLVSARNGAQLWSETYDRDVTDILRVQAEIAANLVRGLQLSVAPSLLSQWASATHDPEAYDLYLRAQHAIYRFNAGGFEQAIGYLRRALELDPTFVAAAESLALSIFDQAEMGFVAPHPGYEQARAAASAVLTLEPDSGAAHAVLGGVLFEHDWAWEAAERELSTAATLAPRNPFVLIVAAEERMAVADWSGALDLLNATNAADPMDAATYTSLACAYLHLGRAAEAEDAARRVLEISPTYSGAHGWLATVLLMESKPEVALVEANTDNPQRPTPLLVAIYHDLHRPRESDAVLARLKEEKIARASLAGAYAYAGRRVEAMDLLEQAFAGHEPELTWINYDPLLMRVADEPRFKRLLRKMNVPEQRRRGTAAPSPSSAAKAVPAGHGTAPTMLTDSESGSKTI